ncbi:hypothetical protein JNK13_11370 [bacterium]|nr:hypothetical protein [bacterium]
MVKINLVFLSLFALMPVSALADEENTSIDCSAECDSGEKLAGVSVGETDARCYCHVESEMQEVTPEERGEEPYQNTTEDPDTLG